MTVRESNDDKLREKTTRKVQIFGNILTEGCKCKMVIKARISMAKEEETITAKYT